MNDEMQISVAVLETRFTGFEREMAAVKDEVKGLRDDISKHLDNEAKKWQIWGEMHSNITSIQLKQEEIIAGQKDHEMRLRRLEQWGLVAYGGMAVVIFILNYFK